MCIYHLFGNKFLLFLVLSESRMNFYVQKNTKGIVYETLRFLYENQRKTKMIGKNTFHFFPRRSAVDEFAPGTAGRINFFE